ncbi:MAG: methyltransferase, FkbM family [Mucilaginibacter sp.]|nr:methyltransferase, FkbM family [Mucilaginibacter sp.]
MRLSLFYNPLIIIDRLAIAINRNKRKSKLRHTPAANLDIGYLDSLELLELIKSDGFNAKTIFDVGANIGTWTLLAKSFFSNAAIHAFEPLSNHIQKFEENTRTIKDVHLHSFCLGNENKESVINVSSFSDSSSILNAAPLEFEQYRIKKVSEEQILIKRLDYLIDQNLLPIPDIVKLDVQGFELEVLKGMGEYLNKVSYLIVEVSFKEYYYGQPLFLDIANFLSAYNFNVYAFGHSTPTGSELGQIDVLFKKQK